MDLCPHCGAALPPGTHACPACRQPLPEPPHPAHAAEEPVSRWRRGPRFVLAFLGLVLLLGLVFVGAVIYFIRHTTIVTTGQNGGRVESPYGTVTAGDPAKLAKSLGLDLYPNATSDKGAQAELPGSILVSLSFRTRDTPSQVIRFYHVRFPDADVKTSGSQQTLVQVGLRETLTIKAVPVNGITEITVSDIRH